MRKLFALILSLALCLSFTAALADQTITVTGSGETLVSADTAIVSVGVSVRKPTAPQAQSAANEVIAAVRATLTAAGFNEEDINTGFVNLYGVYDYTRDIEEIVAYNANSTLAVKVSDMTRVGEVIDLAFGAGANTLDNVSFSVSDSAAAREASLKDAVADAKAKAAVLAEAAGLGGLEVVFIQEGSVYSFDSGLNNFSRKVAGAGTEMDYATVIQAAKIGVSATVTITFRVK